MLKHTVNSALGISLEPSHVSINMKNNNLSAYGHVKSYS